jgi:F-type H+-transporting ATPase subunit b
MLILSDFSVIKPDFGVLFWTVLIFLALWLILGKVAFKPIAAALKEREGSIDDALKQADKARADMQNLVAKNEQLLQEAREEKAKILREAKVMADEYTAQMRAKADAEFKTKVEGAMTEINNRKMEMLVDVKNQAGNMAISIAEKLMQEKLQGDAASEAFVKKMATEIKLN